MARKLEDGELRRGDYVNTRQGEGYVVADLPTGDYVISMKKRDKEGRRVSIGEINKVWRAGRWEEFDKDAARRGLEACRVAGKSEEMSAARFLEGVGRALGGIRRDVEREWDRLGRTTGRGEDAYVDRAMSEVVRSLADVAKDVAVATGVVKSQMAERELAFVSSELERAAEEVSGGSGEGLGGHVACEGASGGMGRRALSKDWTKRLVSVVQSTYEVQSILENTPGLDARKAEKIVRANFDLSRWGEVDWNEFVKAF